MAREPHDVFMREFFDHPAWEGVFNELYKLASDLKEQVFVGTSNTFDVRQGRALGVFDAISQLKTLMKSYNEKG